VRLDVVPFSIRKRSVGQGFLIPARVANYHPKSLFHTVSLEAVWKIVRRLQDWAWWVTHNV